MGISPLRSLDEFLLGGARFQIPDFSNEDRWFNRITSNLLYYQTNYFVSSFVIFILVTFFHPQEMAYGIGVMITLFGLAFFARSQKAELETFKKNHPFLYILALFAVGYFIIYKLGCVVVFLLGIMLPIVFVFGHASFRRRNVKNKLASATEAFGLAKKSPMAFFLNELGIEPDLKYIN